MPTSFDVWETFSPPRPVNCGVLDNFKKLKIELPPRVCARAAEVINKQDIKSFNRTGYEYEKSFANGRGIF